MADNYIERQYEQYQARKAAWEKAGNIKQTRNLLHADPKYSHRVR